jgi:hypothetical protein
MMDGEENRAGGVFNVDRTLCLLSFCTAYSLSRLKTVMSNLLCCVVTRYVGN